ncbi:MFS general substrate transporter [Hysterangium stoloniferum]|nr:MFS general substrate transporter [Hysterangium stoloniferum]
MQSEKDEKRAHHGIHIEEKQVDQAAHFSLGRELDPEEALRVRRKIDRHILPMMCDYRSINDDLGLEVIYNNRVQFMDKTTLGNSAILGISLTGQTPILQQMIRTSNGSPQESITYLIRSNWLGTVFYVSYLVFEYPQNLGLQRFPVGKWMSINIFCWGIALCAHAACKDFGQLFAVRFIMGMCEGSITAGFMIVTSMFYTHREQSQRVGYWFLMNGSAQIISGFLSFGVLHIHKSALHPWQWFMIITGIMTLILAVFYWILFPDSPANAWFLTLEERKIAVERIKVNQTGIGNKQFKWEQVVECLKEPKTWLFAMFSLLDNIPNSLTNQRSIIINGFGFSVLQTTLLGCVDGSIEIITIFTGVTLAARYKDSIAWVGIIYFVPNVLGSILVNTLPAHNKVGLLCSYWITGVGTTGFVLSLSWVTAVTAGHTKRITMNAIMLCAYCIGNIVGPQMWQARFSPRNRVPWGIISVCYFICPFILYAIRTILSNENKRRDAEAETQSNDSEDLYIEEILADGTKVERKVDKAFLDLTDVQNRDFRYVL